MDLTPFEMFDRHGGVARYGAQLVRGMGELFASISDQAELMVMTRSDAPPVSAEEALAWAADPGPEIGLEQHKQQRAKVLGKRLAEARVDLFHALHPHHLPRRLPPIAVATCHDLIQIVFPSGNVTPRRLRRRRVRTARYYRRFDHVIVVSAATDVDLVRELGFDAARSTVVHQGVDAEVFSPEPGIDAVELPQTFPDRYFVSVGSDYYRKNQTRLVEAWCDVALQIPEDLVLVGRALYEDTFAQIQAYVAERGLASRFRWYDDLEDAVMPSVYRGAAAAIAPSLCEGFGMTLLEAMGCGTPVVCSDNAAYAEVAGDAALYFDGHSRESIAQRLIEISGDPVLGKTLVTRGHARVAELSWEQTAARTFDVYRGLLWP
jgi:glycosyltransferase involved in cell wall biosynthesis